MMFPLVLVAWLASAAAPSTSPQTPAGSSCGEWRECQQMALEAADRHDYETFHDLAWRTVQIGPRRNPDLMYLLARAQCLSGRPHDALIMLTRLTELGVSTDAATNDDFKRTRALPEWQDFETRIRSREAVSTVSSQPASPPSLSSNASPVPSQPASPRSSSRASTSFEPTVPRSNPAAAGAVTADASVPSSAASTGAAPTSAIGQSPKPPPANTSSANAPSAAVRAPDSKLTESKSNSIEQLVRVPGPSFSAAGLAYDAVSRRFVVGDLRARKLMVVGESADHAVDLVRADSAGFHDISSMEIDGRRGDLWVVTSASAESDWTIHRMQLLSGRPLKTIPVPTDLEPMRLVDIALSPSGTVLALDGLGNRLFALRPGATKLEVVPKLTLKGLTSVTTTGDEAIVYIAHEAGISRVDLKSGSTMRLNAPRGFSLKNIERIRSHGNLLLAVQADATGARRIVRFKLNAAGRVATGTILEASIPSDSGPTFATVSGDELSYLVVANLDRARPDSQDSPSGAPGEFVIHRIRLN